MSKPIFRNIFSLFCLVLAAAGSSSVVAADTGDDDQWHIAGELYFWAADIDGNSQVGGVEVDFKNIFRSLDLAFMGTLGVSKNQWAFFGDVIYLDLSNDSTLQADVGGTPTDVTVDVGMKGFISTLGAGYRFVKTNAATVHVVGGARYLGLDIDVGVTIPGVPKMTKSGSGSVWDGIIGFRGEYALGQKQNWVITYYGDMGTGDSDSTWKAAAAINYRWQRVAAVLGYSQTDWDFDSKSAIKDLSISGPYAGVQYRFR